MRARSIFIALLLLGSAGAGQAQTQCNGAGLPNPVMFVLQYPVPNDFATIGAVFANHRAGIAGSGRGGDLMVCYPDGTLRNLTAEAGFGTTGFQGAQSIVVRDPAVHWTGQKAVFAMAIGAPTQQYQNPSHYFQLYEVTGLAQGQTASISVVPNQPAQYNNVQPAYLPDDRIVFVSDRPRNGQRHLYPQHDEYESTATPTGLWRLDPASGELILLQHSPSGSFDPLVDRHGRIVFTRWDHLQRDQQAEGTGNYYGNFNWASEAADAPRLDTVEEMFPEPRLNSGNVNGLRFNHFSPWQIRADGTGEETLNHIGRHELHAYFDRSFNDDPSLVEFIAGGTPRPNPNAVLNLTHLAEDPTTPGRYLGVDAPEFGTHGSGHLVAFVATPQMQARDLVIQYLHDRSAHGFYENGNAPAAFSGRYRNPVVLSDGTILAAHTTSASYASNLGTRPAPVPSYRFRIRRLAPAGSGQFAPGAALTDGIERSVSFWDPDVMVTYSGEFWELSPVEVVARERPPLQLEPAPEPPEQQAAAAAGANLESLRQFMRAWNLGLVVVRNATTRDRLDRQQPFNLRVPGGVQTLGNGGRIYDVTDMQMFQADQIRGIGGINNPRPGRRVLAQVMHDPAALRFLPPNPDAPDGSAVIASDGSVAMFVPARRALSWQLTGPQGEAVVRERYWLTLQPGEIRACDGCHGSTPTNQAGQPVAANMPIALRDLLGWFAANGDPLFADDFE
jgi:hypothetical protein